MDTLHRLEQPVQVEFGHQVWPATPRHLRSVRAAVRRWLVSVEVTDAARGDLLLAVNEAVTNSIEHGYRETSESNVVELTFWSDYRQAWLEVVDHGRWLPPVARPYRTRGIALMHRLVDSVLIHHDSRGTRVLLGFFVPGQAHELSEFRDRPVRLDVPSQSKDW